MSFLDKILNNGKAEDDRDRYLDDDYDDGYDDGYDDVNSRREPEKNKRFGLFQKKVIDGAPQGMQLVTVIPTTEESAKDVCDYLLEGKIVVLNMEGISTDIAQRVIDFTLGAVYAIEGHLQGITRHIFVATPMSVELSGEFMDDVVNGNSTINNPKPTGYSGFRYNV